MKNIFRFRDQLVENYSAFSQGFNTIRENDIRETVDRFLKEKRKFCPEPLVQLNMPLYQFRTLEEVLLEKEREEAEKKKAARDRQAEQKAAAQKAAAETVKAITAETPAE